MSVDYMLEGVVSDVLVWLHEHPHRDYVDACFAVVCAPPPYRSYAAGAFSTGRWPELVEAVKRAVQNQQTMS